MGDAAVVGTLDKGRELTLEVAIAICTAQEAVLLEFLVGGLAGGALVGPHRLGHGRHDGRQALLHHIVLDEVGDLLLRVDADAKLLGALLA